MAGRIVTNKAPLLLYDGVCALCNGAVRFVLARDRAGTVSFAPLQGETARALRAVHSELEAVDSMIWIDADGGVAVRSDAAIAIGRHLGGLWRAVAAAARLVPRPLRDRVYDWVAGVRDRVFGRYESCPIPPARHRERFLA
jgi:predicted DCC family thiol-disulfide oxidoreductase YuxK